MTRLIHWIFVRPRTGDPAGGEVVEWRHFRHFRAVMLRGVVFIIAAQIILAFWIYRTGETGRNRVANATYQNCRNIEVLRKAQRDQLLRTLASYDRADVRKLLGPRLVELGRRQARLRLAELQPIDCRVRRP